MNNIISLSARRQGKSERLKYVIAHMLASGQSIIVGTEKPQQRYNEIKEMFPDAELEIVKLGVKVWKKK